MASENPVKNRARMKAVLEVTMAVEKTAGAVRRVRAEEARRGPKRSQAVPMARRARTAPETAAIPAFPMSVAERLRSSRMMGISGGAAKVETKQAKKESQERWKARMWGEEKQRSLNCVALCSESTGSENLFCGDSSSLRSEVSILGRRCWQGIRDRKLEIGLSMEFMS